MKIHSPVVKPIGFVANGPVSRQIKIVNAQCHPITTSRLNARRKSAYTSRFGRASTTVSAPVVVTAVGTSSCGCSAASSADHRRSE